MYHHQFVTRYLYAQGISDPKVQIKHRKRQFLGHLKSLIQDCKRLDPNIRIIFLAHEKAINRGIDDWPDTGVRALMTLKTLDALNASLYIISKESDKALGPDPQDIRMVIGGYMTAYQQIETMTMESCMAQPWMEALVLMDQYIIQN